MVDSNSDSTIDYVIEIQKKLNYVDFLINNVAPGASYAMKFGMLNAKSNVIVLFMADGSDDPECIPKLVKLVERGVSIACASRYMPGGQLVNAPFVKSSLSKFAGKSLHMLTRVGTKDCTNSFKAYSRTFLNTVEIESTQGFVLGIELIAKALKHRQKIAEVPTIWIERSIGTSKFKVVAWLPKYLKWYLLALYWKAAG